MRTPVSRTMVSRTASGPHVSAARVPVAAPRIFAPPQALSTPVGLHYLRNSPIRVRGAVSGRHYDFSSSRPAQSVDRRDLAGLLRTGFFRQS
jgi:hypothetical protein